MQHYRTNCVWILLTETSCAISRGQWMLHWRMAPYNVLLESGAQGCWTINTAGLWWANRARLQPLLWLGIRGQRLLELQLQEFPKSARVCRFWIGQHLLGSNQVLPSLLRGQRRIQMWPVLVRLLPSKMSRVVPAVEAAPRFSRSDRHVSRPGHRIADFFHLCLTSVRWKWVPRSNVPRHPNDPRLLFQRSGRWLSRWTQFSFKGRLQHQDCPSNASTWQLIGPGAPK